MASTAAGTNLKLLARVVQDQNAAFRSVTFLTIRRAKPRLDLHAPPSDLILS
jgi:hypothetical protein